MPGGAFVGLPDGMAVPSPRRLGASYEGRQRMAAFFFFLAILIECGPFPMSFSDCGPRKSPTISPIAVTVEAP